MAGGQFGMSWSNYSVFVGNIFGAPVAMQGLLAFFLESTFIGLWLFGRNRLPPLLHALSICIVSLGTIVSAFFILTANAWMQHPVGYRVVGHQAELTDFWAVLRNSTLWAEFTHTVLAAFVTGAMFVLGCRLGSCSEAGRRRHSAGPPAGGRRGAGGHVPRHSHRRYPGQADGQPAGPGSYVPVPWVTYWSFRLMVGLGLVMLAASACALWLSRRGAPKAFELRRRTLWVLAACSAAPFRANTFGWPFTEMGRQPWIVYGLMKTGQASSPSVSTTDVALTLGGFTLLGVIDVTLMAQASRRGLDAGMAGIRPGPPPVPRASQPPRNSSTGRLVMNGPVASLNTAWFALIGLLRTGYFVLERFDTGVGMLSLAIGRDDTDRRLARNAIGPSGTATRYR